MKTRIHKGLTWILAVTAMLAAPVSLAVDITGELGSPSATLSREEV